jgi:hypothetical protein
MASTFEPSSPNDHETDLGQNPIDLYFESDSDTRANILLNHPQVIGFVYFNEGSVTKAFLPKRIIDWGSSRKIIAAVSGSPDDFVPFSVTESDLCSNNLLTLPESFGNITLDENLNLCDNRQLKGVPNCFPKVKGEVLCMNV